MMGATMFGTPRLGLGSKWSKGFRFRGKAQSCLNHFGKAAILKDSPCVWRVLLQSYIHLPLAIDDSSSLLPLLTGG